ncbi:MAG: hypothetical protein ABH857_05815 [Elusimicrobiota bacterium]
MPINTDPFEYLLEELKFNSAVNTLNIQIIMGNISKQEINDLIEVLIKFRRGANIIGMPSFPFKYELLRWKIVNNLDNFKLPKKLTAELEHIYKSFEMVNKILDKIIKQGKIGQQLSAYEGIVFQENQRLVPQLKEVIKLTEKYIKK